MESCNHGKRTSRNLHTKSEVHGDVQETNYKIKEAGTGIIQITNTKPLAGDIDHFLEKRDGSLPQNSSGKGEEEITWKEKLRICNEIEKCLDAKEDRIKTKKLDNELSE